MKTIIRACLIVMLFSLCIPILTADAADATLAEAGLGSSATPASMFTGADGRLYIIDEGSDVLWRINPSSGSFEKYFPAGGLMDAAPDGAGKIWWTNGATTFGYFDTQATTNSLGYWQAPQDGIGNVPNIGPLVVMDGKIWIATYFSVLFGIYSFTPGANGGELCHYMINNGSYATDLVVENGRLWWLNWRNEQDKLMSLTPGVATAALTTYALSRNVNSRAGMLVSQGNLWWAEDAADRDLYRFNPNSGAFDTFNLPAGAYPIKVSAQGGKIWYTDNGGWFGSLDPAAAASTPGTLTAPAPEQITPECYTLGAPTTIDDTPPTGALVWSANPVSSTITQPLVGVEKYALPAGALPLGIAAGGSRIWVGADGRNSLLKLDSGSSYTIYLPAVLK